LAPVSAPTHPTNTGAGKPVISLKGKGRWKSKTNARWSGPGGRLSLIRDGCTGWWIRGMWRCAIWWSWRED